MNKWCIKYWTTATGKSPIEKWLDSLDNDQLKSVAKELKMLEKAGRDLKMPHSFPLGEGLFELRERRYGYRMYYGFRSNFIIVVLAAGDKKSQSDDIKKSRTRLLGLGSKTQ